MTIYPKFTTSAILKRAIYLCALTISVSGVSACTLNKDSGQLDTKTTDKIVSNFFVTLKTNGSAIALDSLFNQTGEVTSTNEFSVLRDSLTAIENISGKFEGQELITKKTVGTSLILYSYMAKYDLRPLRFLMMFYKPGNKWLVYKFSFDSEIESELEQSTKVYFLSK